MELKEWKKKGKYFEYKTHPIFTIDEGKGEVLLLIHGFPTASWDWSKIWSSLTERYRVLTLDMIGFGFSGKPRQYAYSILDQADLIEQFLKSKAITKIQIISHDYGNTVTQELLARHRERDGKGLDIGSVCFLNGGLFAETHRPLLVQKMLMSPIGWLVGKLFNRKKLGKNFKEIFGPNTQPTVEELDDFWSLIINNDGKNIVHLLIRYIREREQYRDRWVQPIQETNMPIRLINGVVDPISGQHLVDRYREIIPNPDVIELENIGHFPLLEAPKLVLKYYFDFLCRNKAIQCSDNNMSRL